MFGAESAILDDGRGDLRAFEKHLPGVLVLRFEEPG